MRDSGKNVKNIKDYWEKRKITKLPLGCDARLWTEAVCPTRVLKELIFRFSDRGSGSNFKLKKKIFLFFLVVDFLIRVFFNVKVKITFQSFTVLSFDPVATTLLVSFSLSEDLVRNNEKRNNLLFIKINKKKMKI